MAEPTSPFDDAIAQFRTGGEDTKPAPIPSGTQPPDAPLDATPPDAPLDATIAQLRVDPNAPAPPPGVMIHEANRSYIVGGPNAPYVDTTGMDQAQRAEAARALEMRRRYLISDGGQPPAGEPPIVAQQNPQTGNFAPYTARSPESVVPALQGVTLGFGDEAISAGAGAGNWLRGGEFGSTYNLAQEVQRQALAQQREQHPVQSAALQTGGALVTAPLLAAPALGAAAGLSLPWQIAGGGVTGGLLGGLEGFGSGSGFSDRLSRAGTGAAYGTALGAGIPATVGAGRAGRDYLSDIFASPATKALNLVGKDLRADVAAGGPGPLDITDKMKTSPSPVLPVDVAGENVRERVGEAARIPGPGRAQITGTFDVRDTQAPNVLGQAVDAVATGTPGRSTFMAGRALEQQAQADATPLYGRAYMAPVLNPDHVAPGGELDTLLQRDSMKKAMTNALKIAREQGTDPNSLGITFNEAGDPIFKGVPSWRTLDYTKRGMDDVVASLREPVTGKLDTYGNAANQTRKDFLEFLDNNNPHYAPARAAWSGPQRSREALDEGARVFTKHPDEIAFDLSELSPTDQQFYRLGAANALRTDLAKTSSGGNEALKLIGNQNRQDQLTAVFPNADRLLDVGNAEKLKFQTMRDIVGGPDTARRVAQDTPRDSGVVSNAFQVALNYLTGGVAGKTLTSAGRDISSRSMSPETANEIAGRLLQSDPTLARAWLQNAFERNRSPWRSLY